MKICLMPHPNTAARFSYLTSNFRNLADIEIWFPEEDFNTKNADIFILEEELSFITERLLSQQNPPLIVIPKEGRTTKRIRYLPDFSMQFPKLMKEINECTPTIQLQQKHKLYFYNQQDILYLQKEKSITICFRQGTKIVSKQSFEKISKQLSLQLFFPVDCNTFVNTAYVAKITDEAVFMENGKQFHFHPESAQQVKNAFFKAKYFSNNSND